MLMMKIEAYFDSKVEQKKFERSSIEFQKKNFGMQTLVVGPQCKHREDSVIT